MGSFFTVRRKGIPLAKRYARTAKELGSKVQATMQVAVALVEADLKQNSLTGTKGVDPFWGVTGAKGNTLGVRSGHFRRSIARAVFTRFPASVVGTVGSPLAYAKLHEEGGSISGKPWLRVPTRVMQTSAGVDKLAGRSARTLPNTFILKSKKGNRWIAEGGTARSKLAAALNGVPLLLYMLVKSMTFRRRAPFGSSLNRMRAKVLRMLGGTFVASVRGN